MEADLEKLNDELALQELPDEEKVYVINIYKNWKTCFQNQIMITDIKGARTGTRTNIKINDNIQLNGKDIHKNISRKSTIFFSNCSDLNVLMLNKVNHVIIENCKNINFKTTSGIIGGIDILRSSNVNLVVTNRDIFYIGFGGVYQGNIFIEKSLALNTVIRTLECNIINFALMLNEVLKIGKYLTNASLFSGLHTMMFIKNKLTDTLELHYLDGINKEIIYPSY